MGKKNREDSAGFKIGVQIAKQAIDLGDMRKERDAALAERDAARGERDALREACESLMAILPDRFPMTTGTREHYLLKNIAPRIRKIRAILPVPEKGGEE